MVKSHKKILTLLEEILAADAILCQYGYLITAAKLKKYLDDEDVTLLFKKMTVVCERKIGPAIIGRSYKIEHVPQYNNDNVLQPTEDDDHIKFIKIITLPRSAAAKLIANNILPRPRILFKQGRQIQLKTAAGFELLEDQKKICSFIWEEHLSCGKDPLKSTAVLNFATGYGKTYIAAGLINLASVMTAVILPNVGLVKQTIDVFTEIWPDAIIAKFNNGKFDTFTAAEIKIGRGKTSIQRPVDVFISTIDSWLLAAKTKKFGAFDDLGLIIFDEIHTIGGINRMSMLFNTHVPLMFGMSATTAERADEFDKLYIHHLGPLIKAENIPGFSYDENNFFGKIIAVNYFGPDELTAIIRNESTNMISAGAMIKNLAADSARNTLIAKIVIKELKDKDRYIYIFSESLEHLENIKKKIIEIGGSSLNENLEIDIDNDIHKLTGGAKAEEIVKVRECSTRVILTTYGYGGTGFSINRMNTEIIASPRKRNFMQITGRIFRRGSDTTIERRIYDIIDVKSILKHQFKSRRMVYESRGLKIKFIDSSFAVL
jgi:superfamily II DNA or RNA helicase